MGFRKDGFATIWSIEPESNTITRGRISISKKNQQTGEYEQDFSGFVTFAGTAAASKAAKLKEKDRIKLGDVDVTNRYDKEKGITYTNFTIFSFETQEESKNHSSSNQKAGNAAPANVDDGEVEAPDLPF